VRDRLRSETGLGLPLTMAVLLITLTLAGWVATASQESHSAATTDRSSKRALGAAEAGLARAAWRLDQQPAIASNQCLLSAAALADGTAQETIAAPLAGVCPASTTATLGNGAAYSFTVTAQNTVPTTCAGEPSPAGERCATAIGTVAGVTRRVQARLATGSVATTYTHTGIVGRTSVRLGNSVEMWTCGGETPGRIGSNTSIDFGNSIKLGESCGGSGSWGVAHPGTPGLVSGSPSPYPSNTVPPTTHTLPNVDPGNTATVNDNALLTGSGYVWDGGAAARTLRITSNKVIPAGTYNLCSLTLDGGNIDVVTGGTATIYIDSPDRAGSGCAAGTGGFWAKNGESTNWGAGGDVKSAVPATRAPWLRLLVVGSTAWESGTRPCNGNKAGAVLLCNSNRFAGTIYAPASKVVLSNSVEFVGAIAADRVDLENSVRFRLPTGLSAQTVGTTPGGAVMRRWTECRSKATGTTC
jgi:Tfp pilus assembly protein PilX